MKCRVVPSTLTVTCAGAPLGRLVVLSTCAALTVLMASMSALRLLSCARISAEELGVLLAGLLGSKAMA